MQGYDTLLITRPTVGPSDIDGLVEKVTKTIESNNGDSVKVKNWGVKRLAYEIAKCREGNYILFSYNGVSDTVNKVAEILNYDGDVIRFMTTRQLKSTPVRADGSASVGEEAE
jgi:small subunit ribosomal protein S6